MKTKILSLLVVSLFTTAVYGQKEAPPRKEQVEVTHWGSRSFILLTDFWNPAVEVQVLKQMSKDNYEYMKQHIQAENWPQFVETEGLNEEEAVQFGKKLNELKMYRVATFDNIRNGENFGNLTIIYVPYEENIHWKEDAKWNASVYFLLKTDDVKTKKQ